MDKKKLQESFVGKNYEKMLPKMEDNKFHLSGWSFLFGWIYWVYRKMYVEAAIGVAVSTLIVLAISAVFGQSQLASSLILVIPVLYMCSFYFLYKRKMDKALEKCETRESAAKLGGVNTIATGVIAVLATVYFVFSCLYAYKVAVNTTRYDPQVLISQTSETAEVATPDTAIN